MSTAIGRQRLVNAVAQADGGRTSLIEQHPNYSAVLDMRSNRMHVRRLTAVLRLPLNHRWAWGSPHESSPSLVARPLSISSDRQKVATAPRLVTDSPGSLGSPMVATLLDDAVARVNDSLQPTDSTSLPA
jgi:hypothetical protein